MTNDAAIIAAAEHRARPICLTACAAILGMIPISHRYSGDLWRMPLSGLLVATLVTLTVLPASFSLLLQWGTVYATGTAYKTRSVLKAKLSPIRYAAVSAKRVLRTSAISSSASCCVFVPFAVMVFSILPSRIWRPPSLPEAEGLINALEVHRRDLSRAGGYRVQSVDALMVSDWLDRL